MRFENAPRYHNIQRQYSKLAGHRYATKKWRFEDRHQGSAATGGLGTAGTEGIEVAIVSEPGYLPRTADQRAVLLDYADNVMPIIKKLPNTGAANYTVPPEHRIITAGQIEQATETAIYLTFRHFADQPTEVIYRQVAFPGWQIIIDREKIQWTTDTKTGWIKFLIPAGNHKISIAYTAPPGAMPGRWVTFITIVGLCLAAFWTRYKKHPAEK